MYSLEKMSDSFNFPRVILVFLIMFAGSAAMAKVSLVDLGGEVELYNGIVSVRIGKENGRLLSLKHNGDEILGNGGVGYLQVVVNKKFSGVSKAAFKVVSKKPDMIDVSHVWVTGGIKFDYHYVLRDGENGLYSYMTMDYRPLRAAKAQIEQITYVLRTDKEMFDRLYVEDDRIFDMPSGKDISEGKTLSPPEATLLKNSRIDHKYRFSNFLKDTDIHGWTGDRKGHWMIFASNEYVNGGPTHQELTVHQTRKTPCTMRQYHAAHYGAGVTNLDASDGTWKKIYGPWMIYVNEGSRDEMWADAKKKVAKEKEAWPYGWLRNSLYPSAKERSTVKGKINITDGSSAKGAMVILAQPTDGTAESNWQRQGKDYWFWAEAERDGSFEIDKVRPGEYTLYSFVSGVFDEYRQDGVEVKPGSVNDLGEIKWTPRTHGKLIWQIGVPDRTAGEYLHGEEYRQWGLWLEYPKDFPDGVNFTIGKSKEATDWNFNQWCVEDGVNIKGRKKYKLSPWTIKFDMDEIFGGKAVLSIGIASARNGYLKVLVNGKRVFEGELESGGAAHREGIQGFYHEKIIEFDSSLLNTEKTNRIVLEQLRAGCFQSIMYDVIRLEIE